MARRERWPALPAHRRFADLGGGVSDLLAALAATVLVALGVLNTWAVSGLPVAEREAVLGLVGLVLLLVLRRSRLGVSPTFAWSVYGLSVLLLVAVKVVGVSANGARRWIEIGSVTFEPSELAELGLLLVLAHLLGGPGEPGARRVLVAVGVSAVPVVLTATEPDLSTALLMVALTVTLLVVGRVRARVLVPLVAAALLAAPLVVGLLRPYQLSRIQGFLTGSAGSGSTTFTLEQAKIAVASGGAFGQAGNPLHGLLSLYLPGATSDLAFDSLVEQWGLIAAGAAVLAVFILVWRLALASRVAPTRREGLLPAGLAMMLGVESVVSLGGNLGLLPLAGVPFPLLSLGGSAMVVDLAAIGLTLGVRRKAARSWLWAPPRWVARRPRWVRLGALLSSATLAVLASYGWRLQSAQGAGLRLAASTEMTRCVAIPAPRGEITDRHGTVLAYDAPDDVIEVVPSLLSKDPSGVAALARLLGVPPASLDAEVAANRRSLALQVATVADPVGEKIARLGMSDVIVAPSQKRIYPFGPLLAPLLGYVGVATPADVSNAPNLPPGTVVGRAGIEEEYDPVLRGVDGEQCMWVDPAGTPVAMANRVPPVPGANLELSIDLGLQERLTSALESAAVPGAPAAAVAMNPRNGQILAMASVPSYDDNLFGPPVSPTGLQNAQESPGDPMLEHVTQTVAPPGSTFKLVVGSADAVYDAVPPSEVVPTGGSFTFDGHTFHNWADLPPMDLPEAIGWSNDVYFYKLALALGANRIHQIGAELGVGRPTGVDLPGEDPGYFGSPSTVTQAGGTWYPGETVILGIGQGAVEVTPLQNARWTAAVATGELVTPRVGLAVVNAGASPQPLPAPAAEQLPFAGRLGVVRQGMRYAVTNGIATAVKSLPFDVGAKTGTAQDPSNSNGHSDAWFTAAAPMSAPTVVITALVRGGGDGDATAGPVVAAGLQYFFTHEASVLSSQR